MKKLFKWLGIILLILFVLIIILPIIFKNKIVTKVKEEANKTLNAKFDFSDVSLSLIRHFPNFSMTMDNLSIINVEPFAGDTLVYSKTVSVTVDLMSVISGDQLKIRSVDLDSPVMNFLVTREGKPNWDIMKPSAAAAKTESKLLLSKPLCKNIQLRTGGLYTMTNHSASFYSWIISITAAKEISRRIYLRSLRRPNASR